MIPAVGHCMLHIVIICVSLQDGPVSLQNGLHLILSLFGEVCKLQPTLWQMTPEHCHDDLQYTVGNILFIQNDHLFLETFVMILNYLANTTSKLEI